MSETESPSPIAAAAAKGELLVHVPHSSALGMRFVEISRGSALLSVAYDAKLVGNPETGILHGGVITSLLDNASGLAVQSLFQRWVSIATLDLRIDYMRPATQGEDLLGWAECYRKTRNIAFVRGIAYHVDRDDPIATSVATFMLDSDESRRLAAEKGEAGR